MQFRMLLLILGAALGNAMVADSKGLTESEDVARARRIKDAGVFESFDSDKSGFLEANEMAAVVEKAGINTTVFDWHKFDGNKDGRLSEDEFVMAGPAALAATFPRDQRIFKEGDLDHSGFLEEKEMEKVLNAAGIDPEGFNWYAFDHDGDGRLNEEEFLESGPAAADAARIQQAPKTVFKVLDVDGNGLLKPQELLVFMKDMGIHPGNFNLPFFDTDGDGGLNEKEFIAAGPALSEARRVSMLGQDGQPAQEANPVDLMQKEFAEVDKDGSKFLEPAEMKELMNRYGLSPAHFNWRAFDHDGDGRLNFEEFMEASPHQQGEQAQGEQPVTADQVFKGTDVNKDGLLEEEEMEHLIRQSGITTDTSLFNWRSFDHDGDGKLNMPEFVEADKAVMNLPPPYSKEYGEQMSKSSLAQEHFDEYADAEVNFAAQTKKIFQEADSDASNYLEEGEIEEFLEHLGHVPETYDWESFDQDKDGRLSEAEFARAGPAAVEEIQRAAEADGSVQADHQDEDKRKKDEDIAALLETDDDEDAEEFEEDDEAADLEKDDGEDEDDHPVADGTDDLMVYNDTDTNKDGFCDAKEMAALEKMAGIKGIDWRKWDADKDGKLSKAEFLHYCQVSKDHASVAFKRHIMVQIGEIEKDEHGKVKVNPAMGWEATLPAEDEHPSDVPAPLKKVASAATSTKVAADGSLKSLMRAADKRNATTKAKADADLKQANDEMKKLEKVGMSAGVVDEDSAIQVSSEPMMRTAQRHVNA